jgi:hypothetical protein
MEILKLKTTLSYTLIAFMFLSCNSNNNCELWKEDRLEENCELIVEIPPKPNSVYFKVSGKSLDGKMEDCQCDVESRWWASFSDKIEKGDTIIKKKGTLTFTIRKKDTILKFNWECKGKIYN